MAAWFKALSLIALCLSPLYGACEEVASYLGLCGGLRRVLLFPPPLTTGWSSLVMAEKSDDERNSKSKY